MNKELTSKEHITSLLCLYILAKSSRAEGILDSGLICGDGLKYASLYSQDMKTDCNCKCSQRKQSDGKETLFMNLGKAVEDSMTRNCDMVISFESIIIDDFVSFWFAKIGN